MLTTYAVWAYRAPTPPLENVTRMDAPAAELIYAEAVFHADAEDDCPEFTVEVTPDPMGGVICAVRR